MTDPSALALVGLAVLGGLLILGLGLAAFSRFDQGSSRRVPAGYRASGEPWRRGHLRMEDDRVEMRGPGGLSAGPWLRGNLDLGIAGRLDAEGVTALGREGLIQVPVRYGQAAFELALDEQHYTALRAWAEAAPPGWNHPRT